MSENRSVTVLDGKKKATLPGEFFDVQTNVPLIHQVVVAQLAAARQGTHATKTRGMVAGGGAKPWRQKGTGRARQGSRRAPQFTGGGTVHGPQPRSYAQRTPKKMISAALRGALSDRARDERIHVIGSIVSGEQPSTKDALKSLSTLSARQLLVVLSRDEDVAWLSLRNVPSVQAIAVDQLNAYDVLVADDVVFTVKALQDFTGGELEDADEPAEVEAKPKAKAKADKPEAAEAEKVEAVAAEAEAEDKPKAKKAPAKKAEPVAEAAEAEAKPKAKKAPAKKEAEAESAEEQPKAKKAPAKKAEATDEEADK
jgi:large subunit ribosomal protein L4